ncbi:hypothetical protein SB749_15080 [Brevibacterium sp. SIMBA_078]|uniref:hypothetical protein n=1 Tax=Brevibacterium sp. SIMBA_078 TaxID=3085816 RepID=UPI00397DE2D8
MTKDRTHKQQERLNTIMRRQDVKEYLASQALTGRVRASAEHTRRFLELAPLEVHVLLDEILPATSAATPVLPRHEEAIAQCLVGMIAEKNLDRILLDLSRA